jgi:uncharacterized protein (DUF302 family)
VDGGDMSESPTPVPGSEAGIVTKATAASVAETLAKLLGLLEERGIKVFAVVDHSGEAEQNGLELRETKLVIFGNPVAGTPVMQAVPLAAIDLPLKILIWDSGGETSVSYVTPTTIAARYRLSPELRSRLEAVESLADALVAK